MENSETGLAELLTGRWSSPRSAVGSPSRLPGCTHAVHSSISSVSGVVMQHVGVKAKFLSRPRVGSSVRLPPLTANCTVEQRTSQNRTQNSLATAARSIPRLRDVEAPSPSSSDASLRSTDARHAVSSGKGAAEGHEQTK